MTMINPYLNFNGNTEEAFNFYRSVFGGEFATLQRFKGSPGCEQIPEADANQIMHVALPVGGNLLMGTDVPSIMPPVTQGTAISIAIAPESEEETHRIFKELSAGGTVMMPLDKMNWGALFGMLTDKFGVQWMLNFEYNKPA